MLIFRTWYAHNKRALKDVLGKREKRGVKMDAPLSFSKVIVATHLDEQFAVFAEKVGGAGAESYFLRSLQYAAEHDGLQGAIRVDRDKFGPLVLSRRWHLVSRAIGRRVYDALLASTICLPLVDDLSQTGPQTGLPQPYPSPEPTPEPSPSTPHQRPPADAAEGGALALPSVGEPESDDGPGDLGPPLVPDDLGVFEMLWRSLEKLRRADAKEAERLRLTLVEERPDNDGIRRFIERLTPSRIDDVTKVRRAFRMAANARNGDPAR